MFAMYVICIKQISRHMLSKISSGTRVYPSLLSVALHSLLSSTRASFRLDLRLRPQLFTFPSSNLPTLSSSSRNLRQHHALLPDSLTRPLCAFRTRGPSPRRCRGQREFDDAQPREEVFCSYLYPQYRHPVSCRTQLHGLLSRWTQKGVVGSRVQAERHVLEDLHRLMQEFPHCRHRSRPRVLL